MNIKQIIIGEKMPDKNDPKYKELHESSVEAGIPSSSCVSFSALSFSA